MQFVPFNSTTPPTYYRTRSGRKVRIYATDCTPMHGAILMGAKWSSDTWYPEGNLHCSKDPAQLDLTGPWVEPLSIPWEQLPPEAQWVAMDEDGLWFAYSQKPTLHQASFTSVGQIWRLYPNHIPANFTGSWQESLTERPKAEECWHSQAVAMVAKVEGREK